MALVLGSGPLGKLALVSPGEEFEATGEMRLV